MVTGKHGHCVTGAVARAPLCAPLTKTYRTRRTRKVTLKRLDGEMGDLS